MTMNLISHNPAVDTAAVDWAAVCAISKDGFIFIDEAIVTQAATLLDGVLLTNGEQVSAFVWDEGEPYADSVCGFGPGLLPEDKFTALREILATQPGCIEMLDLVVELGLQISLNGKEFCDAHLKAVNWSADDASLNRGKNNMYAMLAELGIEHDPKAESGEIKFSIFEKAVNDNSHRTDSPERLNRFVQCAKRDGHTQVYWA